jgi:hypothetical protein
MPNARSSDGSDKKTANAEAMSDKPDCFVVMPVTDPEGYDPGHFQHIFDDIFAPACEAAGYVAVRADQIKETNLIHLDVLQRLLDSRMVLCDLSSRNPNVLFELGLRQAFDMPVVLVQEAGTPKIFDIAPLRFTEYRRARVYHEVIEDQRKLAGALVATRDAFEKGSGINSIVKILSLTKPAALPDVQETNRDPAFQIIRAELNDLRNEMRTMLRPLNDREATEDGEVPRIRDRVRQMEGRLIAMRKAGIIDTAIINDADELRERIDYYLRTRPPLRASENVILREAYQRMMFLREALTPESPAEQKTLADNE